MINKKEWGEYSKMIDTFNEMVIEDTRKHNEEWNKKEMVRCEERRKKYDEDEFIPLTLPMLYPFRPKTKSKTVEDYLDWIMKGKPLS